MTVGIWPAQGSRAPGLGGPTGEGAAVREEVPEEAAVEGSMGETGRAGASFLSVLLRCCATWSKSPNPAELAKLW